MIDLGTGIAIAGVSISGGAVAITALKVRYNQKPPTYGTSPTNGHWVCREHSGLVADMRAIKETSQRQEQWLQSIANDIQQMARNGHK